MQYWHLAHLWFTPNSTLQAAQVDLSTFKLGGDMSIQGTRSGLAPIASLRLDKWSKEQERRVGMIFGCVD
jgi:hypothetical protein